MNYEYINVIGISSSMISKLSYSAKEKKLFVTFNNEKVYCYEQVTEQEFMELLQAESMGRHFSQNIKDEKEFTELELS